MLLIAGIYDFLWGLTWLIRDSQYKIDQVLVTNLTFWGWFYLILGVVGVCAGIAVLAKQQWARWFGVAWAFVNMCLMFVVIWAYPLSAIAIIVIDMLVIYGLVGYGNKEGDLAV
jgi:Na+-transporting NADH:ubiquinone oxidoreductase subunit NqrD